MLQLKKQYKKLLSNKARVQMLKRLQSMYPKDIERWETMGKEMCILTGKTIFHPTKMAIKEGFGREPKQWPT